LFPPAKHAYKLIWANGQVSSRLQRPSIGANGQVSSRLQRPSIGANGQVSSRLQRPSTTMTECTQMVRHMHRVHINGTSHASSAHKWYVTCIAHNHTVPPGHRIVHPHIIALCSLAIAASTGIHIHFGKLNANPTPFDIVLSHHAHDVHCR